MDKKIICIVGPTASGKTAVGVKLAKKFNGEIISADSRQVYRGLDIGTGKDLGEYGKIKYYLIDICNPEDKFTVFDWLKKARVTIDDIFSRGKLPIVVGGTGLYVQALTEGFELEQIKNSKLEIRNLSRGQLEHKSLKELQKIYFKLETEARRLDTNNPRRLIRAIEKTEQGISATKIKPDIKILQIGINLPREKLYKKIDRRVDERFKEGMLEEVANLLNSGVNPKWLLGLGLEYRVIGAYLTQNFQFSISNSQSSINDSNFKTDEFRQMAQELKYKIHAYARRQMTWFHHHGNVKWVSNHKEAEKTTKKFLNKT